MISVFIFGLLISVVNTNDFIVREIRESLKCRNNPGMAVSVVKDGRIMMAEGFGIKDVDTKEPVTNTTLFGIASLSKAFAATVLVKILENEKKIKINTKLADIYKDENIFADNLRSSYTTLEDLLAHRVGLPSNNKIRYDTNLTRENVYKRLKYLRGHGEFRGSYYYSNLMYGLLTDIAEKIGGKSWENLVREKLFEPIGMTSSGFATTLNPDTANLAKGYFDSYGELIPVPFELTRRWAMLCGSGCVMSNAVDMSKWMIFHLNGGKNPDGVRVVNEDMLAITHKAANYIPYTSKLKYTTRPSAPVTRRQDNYAMGWRTGYYRGYEMLTHTGSTYGYRSMLTLLPAADLGIFSTMTGDDPGYLYRTSVHMFVADKFLGEQMWLNASTMCSFPEPWNTADPPKSKPKRNKTRLPARNISEYTGMYTHPGYGNLAVTKLGDNQLSVSYGWAEFELYPKSTSDSFYGDAIGVSANTLNRASFIFTADESTQKITRLTIPSFESKVPPVFDKLEAAHLTNGGKNNDTFVTRFLSLFIVVIIIQITKSS